MGLSHKALQDKRAKKAAKRKAATKNKGGPVAAMGATREWGYVATAPIHEVLVPDTLFELGIGNLIFSRKLPDGSIAVAAFLIDTFCLGVKDAFYATVSFAKYEEYLRARLESGFAGKMHAQPPAYVRKLVEEAVAYARELGFDPHPDYKIARQIFGDVEAAACPVRFEFGRDGQPFYCNGPHDTPAMQRRILTQLQRKCGDNGFERSILE